MKRLDLLVVGLQESMTDKIFKLKTTFPLLPIGRIKQISTFEQFVDCLESNFHDLIFIGGSFMNDNKSYLEETLWRYKTDVIIISESDEHFLDSIKLNVTHYLTQPVQEPDVYYSINKVIEFKRREESFFNKMKVNAIDLMGKQLKVASRDSIEFVPQISILSIEADGSYSSVKLIDRKKNILLSKRLKELELELDSRIFMRVHNSFIINLRYAEKFFGKDSLVLTRGGDLIPVSRKKRDILINRIANNNYSDFDNLE